MMSRVSYAVRWWAGDGETFAGRIELGRDELELTGAAFDGAQGHLAVPYRDVRHLYLDRAARRPGARPLLVLVTGRGARIAIESLESLGVLHELADHVAGAQYEAAV